MEIRDLFMKIGKHVTKHKYGLLNILTERLKQYNYIHQVNPENGFKEIQEIKAEIYKIKNSSCFFNLDHFGGRDFFS